MRTSRLSATSAGLCAALLAGCASDLSLSENISIACASDSECPQEFVCRDSISLCVESGADAATPTLTLVSVTPEVARIGSEVVVVVRADEPLFGPPTVALDTSPQRLYSVLESDPQSATLSYTVRGDEPEGVINLIGEAIDRAGNSSSNVSLGSVRLDFTPPRIVGTLNVSPTLLGADQVATVAFSVDEALGSEPEVRVRWPDDPVTPRPATLVETTGESSTPSYTFSVVPAPGGLAGVGHADIEILLTDAVGNSAVQTRVSELDTDLLGPSPILGTGFVRLFPAVENPLRTVTAAGPGTVIQVGIALDEPLGDTPQLVSVPAGLVFAAVSVSETTVIFEAAVPGDLPPTESSETFELTSTDVFGNQATHVIFDSATEPLGVVLDTIAPASPDPERLVFHRSPWGSISTGNEPGFGVTGDAGALSEDTVIQILDREDVITAAELTRGTSDSLGGFDRIELPATDRTRVYAVAVDDAGNQSTTSPGESKALLVEKIHWTASLGDKVAGETFGNPHRFEALEVALNRLEVSDAVELGMESGVGSASDGTGVTSIGAGSWQRIEPRLDELQPTSEHAMDFDLNASSVVSFGSAGPLCLPSSDHFVGFLGGGWQDVLDEGELAPSPRSGSRMVFDTNRNEMVLFGPDDQTWTWDGVEWTQRCLTPPCSDNTPDARQGYTLVFDRNRSVVVLFGGFFGQGVNAVDTDEIWEWNGTTWTEACTTDPCKAEGPGARSGHAAAYDPVAGHMVVYGGSGGQFDTWSWDGTGWTRACDAAPCSDETPMITNATAEWDDANQNIVLFGSVTPPDLCATTSSLLPRTWTWNGSQWTDRSGGLQPTGRFSPRLAYDPLQRHVVLMGGSTPLCGSPSCGTDARLSDTWSWNGTSWSEFVPPVAPSTAAVSSGVWVGGSAPGILTLNDEGDDYRWLGDYWSEQVGTAPSARRGMAFATYLTGDGTAEALMMGGLIGGTPTAETWVFTDGGWSNQATGPSARTNGALAWTGTDIILYGGSTSDFGAGLTDTWRWSPSLGWQSVACGGGPCPPGLRNDHAMAWTGNPDEVLLYGGIIDPGTATNQVSNTVWRFNGTTWVQEPEAGPGRRLSHAMVYDEVRDAVLVTGGYRALTVQLGRLPPAGASVWSWRDGSGWLEARLADPEGDGAPLTWIDGVASYDPDLERSVFFGTQYGDTENFNDGTTWLYNSGATTRPGHRATVALSGAAVDGSETLSDVVVRWLGDATGDQSGSPAAGIRLRVWDQGQWRELTREDTAALTWSMTEEGEFGADPTLLNRLFRGSAREIAVEVAPQYPNGTLSEYASITTDYIEVEVRYRL